MGSDYYQCLSGLQVVAKYPLPRHHDFELHLSFNMGSHYNSLQLSNVLQANSDVLVGVKVEIGEPAVDRPNEGHLEFFVDWYSFNFFQIAEVCSIAALVDLITCSVSLFVFGASSNILEVR